jgi:hypothetical protein
VAQSLYGRDVFYQVSNRQLKRSQTKRYVETDGFPAIAIPVQRAELYGDGRVALHAVESLFKLEDGPVERCALQPEPADDVGGRRRNLLPGGEDLVELKVCAFRVGDIDFKDSNLRGLP